MNALATFGAAVPAKKASDWPALSTIIDLAKTSDRIRSELLTIERGPADGLKDRAAAWRASGGAERWSRSCALQDASCPGDRWADDAGVRREAVAVMLAQLIGSFPTSNLPNATVFTRALLEDVVQLQPGYQEMMTACQRLRRTLKFTPSISEVMDVLEAEKAIWTSRYNAVDDIGIYTEAWS